MRNKRLQKSKTPLIYKLTPRRNKMLNSKEIQPVKTDAFFDELIAFGNFKNDAALCRALRISPAAVSNMRRGRVLVGRS
jgi:hypothetical protein